MRLSSRLQQCCCCVALTPTATAAPYSALPADAAALPKTPRATVLELAECPEALCCSYRSRALLRSLKVKLALQHNPKSCSRAEHNYGFTAGHEGWIQCRPVGSPPEQEAAARVKAMKTAQKELKVALGWKQRIASCGDDVVAAEKVVRDMLLKFGYLPQEPQPQQEQLQAAAATGPEASTEAAAAAAAEAEAAAHAAAAAVAAVGGMGFNPLCAAGVAAGADFGSDAAAAAAACAGMHGAAGGALLEMLQLQPGWGLLPDSSSMQFPVQVDMQAVGVADSQVGGIALHGCIVCCPICSPSFTLEAESILHAVRTRAESVSQHVSSACDPCPL